MDSSFKLFFLLSFFMQFAFGILHSNGNPVSIVTRLIHWDSIKSPCFNNTGCSMPNNIDHSWRNSIAHHAQGKIKSYDVQRPHSTTIEASLLPGEYLPLFFIEFYVANQSTPQYGVMDTASHLLWIQCSPCPSCAITRSPMYNPRMSTTYKHLPCNTQTCNLAEGICDTNNKCIYDVGYSSGPHSIGYLATETLKFETDDEGLVTIPDVVFGCSHDNTNYSDGIMTGVFGLGYHKLSLTSQFEKFSYCIGDIGDANYNYNRLALGDGAILEGDSTSLKFDLWRYYVTLEGISLGGIMLDIPSSTFAFKKRNPNKPADRVIVDSGSPITSLVEDAHYTVMDAVEDMMLLPTRLIGSGDRLCFQGDAKRDTKGFPTLTFHFAGGAELALEPDSLFSQYNQRWFCMTIRMSSKSYSIIGLYAQQYYNVGYYLAGKMIYFQKMDCRSLEG